ncbi:MAG: PHP domain-containing protein [Dehalococcoidia bacterium]|jgi:predicted metal-dependent phosphoesterase TrpH
MKIDLHIHTTCSDGNLHVDEVLREAKRKNIDLISLTDHDSIECQKKALSLATKYGINYITGIELNVTFQYPPEPGRSISLDFLGYQFDIGDRELKNKLELIRRRREVRAREILEKLNIEFDKENIARFNQADIRNVQDSVDGAFGRPHIARYLVEKGIVSSLQEAFDRYLVRLDVPKFPLSLAEASMLIRNAGGILVLAHPSDPHGTSLDSITSDLETQTKIIEEYMLEYVDGIECWHTTNGAKTTAHYIEFAKSHDLFLTGGSDCHQKPIIMGSLDIPDYVAEQFM